MSDTTTPPVAPIFTTSRHSTAENGHHFGKYIKLNVGNHLFLTSFDTLTKEDTMFKAMFSGRMEVVQDSEGTYPRADCSALPLLAEAWNSKATRTRTHRKSDLSLTLSSKQSVPRLVRMRQSRTCWKRSRSEERRVGKEC